MKKLQVCMYSLWLSVILAIFSCQNGFQNKDDPAAAFRGHEVSIYNEDSGPSNVKSFQARVRSFYSRDRTGVDMEETMNFLLSMKTINGRLCIRTDFDGSFYADGVARSVISDGTEIITVLSDSGAVESRMSVSADVSRFVLEDGGVSVTGRINMEAVTAKARALLMDVSEPSNGVMSINVPASLFNTIYSDTGYTSSVTRCNLSFDVEAETMVSSQIETTEGDGTKVVMTSYPLYQEYEGETIKVGEYRSMETIPVGTLDVDDSVVKSYESPEDVPLVSAEELKRMEEEGTVSMEDVPILFGDPSDPSYTEIVVDLYEDVRLNTLSDSYFKIGM